MAEEIFDPLDPLGPEFGKINDPIPDAKGLSAFEGDLIDMPKFNDSASNESYFPSVPKVDNLNRPNREIIHNHVKTNAVNPSIPKKPLDINQYNKTNKQFLDSFFQSSQDKNNYAKIYSYNAGPDGNAFYDRYAAYGQKKFDEIGFSPIRDNEANFNARTTRWDDFSRMMTHSFVPLFTRGFVSGPKSLAKMLTGDFTSSDLEDARMFEEAAAIGQSSKGGIFGFANNTMMNFGYTAGIIGEAVAEEAVGALLAAPTGGSSLIATTANNLLKIPKLFKGVSSIKKGYSAVRNTLKLTETANGARNFWQAAKSSEFLKSSVQALNPLENTMHAIKGLKQADNLTDLAVLSKTAGGFYRDARKINMALSEARLEAGMVENHVYEKLYNEAYKANDNEVPNNKELAEIEKQAKDASLETLLENAGLIYVSNGITFNNITGPKGGIRNFIKSTTDDIYDIASREGNKNFGKIGKVIYDRTAKKFALEKNNLKNLAKGWLKNPIYKSAASTVGYFKSNFAEGIQENLQETIAEANEKYFIDSYKSPTLQTMLYSRAAMRAINRDKLDYFNESWAKQNPFTAQGAETFASGFLMGTLASPINSAVPFLSSTYNRMFNKEQYAKWKDAQTTVAQNLVKQLNDMSLKTFMSNEMENLGVQDLVGQVRNKENKKAGLDSEMESYIVQVEKLKETGTFGIFKEKLQGLKELTDEEFADAVNIDLEQVPKYRNRIDKSISRLEKIKNLYDKVEKKNPSPITGDINPNDPNYVEKLILHKAWSLTNRNMVFFNEAYDDALRRRSEITDKFNSNPKLKNINNRQRNLLFKPIRPYGIDPATPSERYMLGDMVEELDILRKEIQSEKEGANNPGKVKVLEDKIKITEDYMDKYLLFDAFFNRADYTDKIAEEIKSKTGKEATTEEIVKYMEDNLGSLDDENKSSAILKDLKNSYTNYLQTLAKQSGQTIFSDEVDETFDLLIDHYKLGHESQAIEKYIEVLNDQESFLDVVRRNTEWLRVQTDKRVKYFEDLIASEMDKVRNNAFLNELANKGYYMNLGDMENYFLNGVPPTEIFNNITKEIYYPNSPQYIEIYKEYFQKREDLKSQQNPKKTGIVDDAYNAEIEKLEAEKQAELDALPKTKNKVEKGTITPKGKNKTISIKEVVDQIQPNEYITLSVVSKDGQISFDETYYMNEDSELLYDDEDGEIVDASKIKTRYSNGQRFTYELQADPVEVERITNIYNEKIDAVKQAYVEDKESIELEIPYEEVTQETNLDTPDLLDFRNELYIKYQEEYVESLSAKEQDALVEDSDLDLKTFENWYSQPENKKYFDQYNDKNRPKASEIETVFTVRGQNVDTKTKTIRDLIKYRDDINDQITTYNEELERLNDVTEKEFKKATQEIVKGLQLDVKNLNKVIAARQFANFPESIKQSIRSIQKLFKAQDKVERGVALTEDDKVTGLRKGQKAYRVNGEFHRRMTQAMQDVIEDEYSYQGQKDLDTIFDQTIGKKGLNPKSVSDFVSRLRVLSDSNEDALPGTNKLFFDALEDELKLLPSLTPEQIKLEKQKVAILEKADKEKDAAKKEALYEQAVEIQNKIDGVTTPVSTDAKADVERRQVRANIITNTLDAAAENKDVELEEFLDVLFERGLVKKNNGATLFDLGGGRDAIIFDIDGAIIPIYRSSQGTSSKTKGKWYPFFFNTNEWLVKGMADTYKDGYNNPIIKQILDSLNKNYNYSKAKSKVKVNDRELLDNFTTEEFEFDNNGVGDILNYSYGASILKDWQSKLGNIDVTGYEGYLAHMNAEDYKKLNPTLVKEIEEAHAFVSNQFEEISALNKTAQPTAKDNFDTATKRNTTKDIINSFFAENSYEDSRVAGNFFDLAKDYLESGKKPEFNEKIITREAYDDLIAYLDTIKEKVDSGELYIVGRDLVVFDSNIQHPGGRKDRIAGEIDLILADKDGIYVVDIKSGESKKFLNFNKLSAKKKAFTKRNEYTIQTGGYATMLERMIDRKIAGLAMLPVQRESNKQTNQVTAAGAPLKGSIYNELQYKKDADGNIIINQDIDPKTGKPFNEKQFEQTKNPYKFDFLVPLYRESVQKELDKLFSTREGKLQPGSKRELLLRYQQLRDSLNNITDEATKLNANRVIGLEKLIDKLINVDKIPIPKDIIDQLEEKKKLVKVYTGKEVLKSITKRYKEKLSNSDSIQKKQYDKLKNLKSDVSFDDIDKLMLEDGSDFINEQLEADKNFEYYYNEHDKYKNEDTKSATVNQQLAVQTMKASRLLTDEDIEDNLIDELSMADASELIHEGVKRIQFLKTETTDQAANKFKDYQSNIFSLMTATKANANNLEFVELLDNAIFNAEQGFISEAYESISEKIGKLESELNRKYTKESRAEVITKEINDLNRFNEALAFAYQMPSDIFESVLGKEEEAELIVDEYSNEIKVGDIVYSKQNNNNTKYTVKSITSKNIILKDPKGKEISVEIGKFDEQYITESEMNAGNFTPPEYNPTEGEKSIIEQSQMSVDDFLRNADEDKAKAHQEGINNTPEENRKNLLNTTKDCQ
jgi:hypothetical protein